MVDPVLSRQSQMSRIEVHAMQFNAMQWDAMRELAQTIIRLMARLSRDDLIRLSTAVTYSWCLNFKTFYRRNQFLKVVS